MTALAGYWAFGRSEGPLAACERMLAAQRIYGKQSARTSEGRGIAIGKRLFPTLPEDAFDEGPVVGGGGRWSLVADVRLDRRDELAAALGIGADRSPSLSDSALVMAAVERWEEDAVGRLFDTHEPNPAVFHLLATELGLMDADRARHATHANQLAFRLKLLLAAGLAPQLAACASCGERDHLVAFSGAHGGVVCAGCEAGAFPIDAAAHAFMTAALGSPLAEGPAGVARTLAQVERAVRETVDHHGAGRLRAGTSG